MTAPARLTQVILTRPSESRLEAGFVNSECKDVVWIDFELAKPGKRVRDEDGRIWTVDRVYGTREFADIEKQHAAWKRWAEVLS